MCMRNLYKIGSAIITLIVISNFEAKAQLAKDKCKFLGNVIAGSVPSDFNTYWNQVTPENAGKWESVEPVRDDMRWAGLDVAYNHAKTNGFAFKQHTFVWGQQAPSWISALPATEQKEEVEEWIKSYCEKYPNTDYIDVVNEPLHAPAGYRAALGGTGTTGWDWVIWTFEKARQYCPNAKLALNDYNIISSDGATTAYLNIINLLKERNLIDVIGEQGHFLETTPLATVTGNLDRLAATGIPIHISEYDVNISSDNLQRDKYQEQFSALWQHPGVHGITLWGYKQGAIWRTDAYLVRSSGTIRPAMTWLNTYVPASLGGTFCLPPVGIEENEAGFKVYPSPSNGNFSIELGKKGNHQISVLDLSGSVKQSVNVVGDDVAQIQLQASPGIYILRVATENRATYKKIFIE